MPVGVFGSRRRRKGENPGKRTYQDNETTETDVRQTWRRYLRFSASLFVALGGEMENELARDLQSL